MFRFGWCCSAISSVQYRIPMDEIRLTKIVFDTPDPMVDIVIGGIIGEKNLERIKR